MPVYYYVLLQYYVLQSIVTVIFPTSSYLDIPLLRYAPCWGYLKMALRMGAADLLHRVFILGLAGIGVGGIALGFQVHRDTVRRGEGMTSLDMLRDPNNLYDLL